MLGIEVTWLGIGTFLAGVGALLSGWAAWRVSRRHKQEDD
jgi:hypothetical protein